MDPVATPIDMRPIGVVRSTLRDRREAPRQASEGAPEATLEIDPEFAPALDRVTPGTQLIVVTWLHEADRTVLQVHPRDDERNPLTGVFATRSSDRLNPIGLHRVTVIGTDAPTRVHVDALEAIDGTSIPDLKVAMNEASDA
jgi:tRNA-Thr(GGU) m(6)t(6)A37 methyltransferase TsaA